MIDSKEVQRVLKNIQSEKITAINERNNHFIYALLDAKEVIMQLFSERNSMLEKRGPWRDPDKDKPPQCKRVLVTYGEEVRRVSFGAWNGREWVRTNGQYREGEVKGWMYIPLPYDGTGFCYGEPEGPSHIEVQLKQLI